MQPQDATRSNALQLLQQFAPRMGHRYARDRNFDRGPASHGNVSRLSPYIRRRLLTETEVMQTALAAHGPEAAEKFLQEVLWRSYFKGWLELRPQVWAAFTTGRAADLDAAARDPKLTDRLAAAEAGETGLACFDSWAVELVQTGYLHNHARLWFASIWIFTLGLPWRLGADFFYRNLLDGDPASNTCSWRWVAGLHTRGRPYLAEAENIAQFTEGRFAPFQKDLATNAPGLEEQEPDGLPPVQPLRDHQPPQPGVPSALLFTEEDCSLEDFDLAAYDIRTAARLHASHLRGPRAVASHVARFEAQALADAARRAEKDAHPMQAAFPEELANWAEAAGARQIAMPYVTVGPLSDWVASLRPVLEERQIALTEWRRDWDGLVWPHATAGYFKVKKRLPELLRQAGLT